MVSAFDVQLLLGLRCNLVAGSTDFAMPKIITCRLSLRKRIKEML